MPDPRTCAVCGRSIIWCETVNGGIVALDAETGPWDYAIVDRVAIIVRDQLHHLQAPMLDGLRYRSHVATCKTPERKKHGQGKV